METLRSGKIGAPAGDCGLFRFDSYRIDSPILRSGGKGKNRLILGSRYINIADWTPFDIADSMYNYPCQWQEFQSFSPERGMTKYPSSMFTVSVTVALGKQVQRATDDETERKEWPGGWYDPFHKAKDIIDACRDMDLSKEKEKREAQIIEFCNRYGTLGFNDDLPEKTKTNNGRGETVDSFEDKIEQIKKVIAFFDTLKIDYPSYNEYREVTQIINTMLKEVRPRLHLPDRQKKDAVKYKITQTYDYGTLYQFIGIYFWEKLSGQEGLVKRICPVCKKPFTISRKDRELCSRSCINKRYYEKKTNPEQSERKGGER